MALAIVKMHRAIINMAALVTAIMHQGKINNAVSVLKAQHLVKFFLGGFFGLVFN